MLVDVSLFPMTLAGGVFGTTTTKTPIYKKIIAIAAGHPSDSIQLKLAPVWPIPLNVEDNYRTD